MRVYEALRATVEDGAWVAVVPRTHDPSAPRMAMRWDKTSKEWAIMYRFDGVWGKSIDLGLTTIPARFDERAIDSEWEVIQAP